MLFAVSLITLFWTIPQAYPTPQPLSPGDVPESARPFGVRYGEVAELTAFELGSDRVKPGECLPVTLYWKALAPIDEDFSVYVQLLSQSQVIGQRDTYPQGGVFPTSLWLPGQMIRDAHCVPVKNNPTGPSAVQLAAGLYRRTTLDNLPTTTTAGEPVEFPILATVKLEAPELRARPAMATDANFADRVRLIGYDLPDDEIPPGGDAPVTLYWEVLGDWERNDTIFIHLVDENEQIVGQGDGPPRSGSYPTSLWSAGEAFTDTHRLLVNPDAASGEYRIYAGFYNPDSGERLPVVDAAGAPVADRASLGTVRVGSPPAD